MTTADDLIVYQTQFDTLANEITNQNEQIKIVDAQYKAISDVYSPLAAQTTDPDLAAEARNQITVAQKQNDTLRKTKVAFVENAQKQQLELKDKIMQLNQQQNTISNQDPIKIDKSKFTASYHPWEQNQPEESKSSLAPLAILAGIGLLIVGAS